MPNILLKINLDQEKANTSNDKVMSLMVSELRSLRGELRSLKSAKPTVIIANTSNGLVERRISSLNKRISKMPKSNKALVRELKGLKSRMAKKPRVVNVTKTVTKNIIKREAVRKTPVRKMFAVKKKKKVVGVVENRRLALQLKQLKSELNSLSTTHHMGAG